MFIVKLFLTEKSENDMAPLGYNGINKFIYRIYIILKLITIDFFFYKCQHEYISKNSTSEY